MVAIGMGLLLQETLVTHFHRDVNCAYPAGGFLAITFSCFKMVANNMLHTGDPRFTRFQFTRIHTTRFFQGLRGRGLMGSTEPLILKICSKTCQYCKIQEKFVTFALNQCFSNSFFAIQGIPASHGFSSHGFTPHGFFRASEAGVWWVLQNP